MAHVSKIIPQEITRIDWERAWKAGEELARERLRSNQNLTDILIVWALVVEAFKVSKIAYSAPPRTGYPQKSSLPEAPDDLSYWAKTIAALQGQIDASDLEMESSTPLPNAEQITRASAILILFHQFALPRKGDKSRIKKALALKASGIRQAAIIKATGLNKQSIFRAKEEACADMLDIIAKC